MSLKLKRKLLIEYLITSMTEEYSFYAFNSALIYIGTVTMILAGANLCVQKIQQRCNIYFDKIGMK